jgi:hypothetical protein
MNTPRHDADALKAALTAYLEAERIDTELRAARDLAQRRCLQYGETLGKARQTAAAAIRREGGSLMYDGHFWEVNERGYLTVKPVGVNVDAIEAVKHHEPTELQLTPPASEKVA